MKAVKVSPRPTDYFLPDEFARIVDATFAYGDWKGGRDFQFRQLRLRALVLLLRWSGLSILDGVTLERGRLHSDRLLLYRHKTKVAVHVPLPPSLVQLLQTLPNSNPRYFFWSGNGDPHTAKKGWQRSLRRLFKTVDLKTDDGELKRSPSPHVSRHICRRIALGGRAFGPSVVTTRTSQHLDHGKTLLAICESETATA